MTVLEKGTSRLFAPKEAIDPRRISRDPNGFFKRDALSIDFKTLLHTKSSLISGAPWIGKSTVAQNIKFFLESSENSKYGNVRVELTDLSSAYNRDIDKIMPSWWEKWKTDATPPKAFWLIDSIDEIERRAKNCTEALIRNFVIDQDLSEEHRQKLTLLMFCRDREIPKGLLKLLRGHYESEFQIFSLLGLDEETAKQLTGSDATFESVVHLIKSNSLEAVSYFPVVIDYLKTRESSANITEGEIWKDILKKLVTEKNDQVEWNTTLSDRFEAAQRIAASMLFSASEYIADHEGNDGIKREEFIQREDRGKLSRQAVREVLLGSNVFQKINDTQIVFREFHIQEWLAALAVSSFDPTKLRPLLVSNDRTLNPKFHECARIVCQITDRSETREWLKDLVEQSDVKTAPFQSRISDIVDVLNQLENIASDTEWNLNVLFEEHIHRLHVSGIDEELIVRINNRKKPDNIRRMFLDFVAVLKLTNLSVPVLKIASQEEENISIRRAAAYTLSIIGSEEDYRKLFKKLRSQSFSTTDEKAFFSVVLRELYRRSLLGFIEVYKLAPDPEYHLVDATYMLRSELRESMRPEDAVHLMKYLGIIGKSRRYSKAGKKRWENFVGLIQSENKLLKKAFAILCESVELFQVNFAYLQPYLLAGDIVLPPAIKNSVTAGLERCDVARRNYFLAEIDVRKRDTNTNNKWRRLRSELLVSDVTWLEDLALSLNSNSTEVWRELLSYTYRWEISDYERRRLRQIVRKRAPNVYAAFIAERKRYQADSRQWKREAEDRQRKDSVKQVEINSLVRNRLGLTRWKLQEKFWDLSWICFGGTDSGPQNLKGDWSELSPSLRNRVLDLCEEALVKCKPTEIPLGNTFSGRIIYEALAFENVLKERANSFELSKNTIIKWLPSVIFRANSINYDVLNCCYESNAKATEEAIFRAVRRDFMGETDHMSSIYNVPSRFFSTGLCSRIIKKFVNDSAGHAEKQSECIRKVAEVELGVAVRAATTQLKKKELPLPIRAAFVQVQLVANVRAGMQSFVEGYSAHGKDFLRAVVSGFYDRGESFGVKIGDWPTKELAEMTRILFSAYRPHDDPHYKGAHWISPDDRVIDLRHHCQNALMARDDNESILIIEEIAQTDETLKNHMGHKKATAGMLHLFEQRNEPAPSHPSLSEIVRLLENSNFRLVRDSKDLLNVVSEELRVIGQSVGHHLRTLYHTGCSAKGCSAKSTHLPEKALQEYLHARLSDRLPNGVLGPDTRIEMFKEAEQAKRRRTDLEVSVATFIPSMAKVVVEVKWSDNPELATGISEQLGKNYLVKENRTHGIYVVGWCGKMTWQNCQTTSVTRQNRTPQSLMQALKQEARLFMDSNPIISILPVVLDIAWKDSSDKSEKRRKSAHKTSKGKS